MLDAFPPPTQKHPQLRVLVSHTSPQCKNKQPDDISPLPLPLQNQITSISPPSFIIHQINALDPARPDMSPPSKPSPSRRRTRGRRAGAAVPPVAAAGVAGQEPDDDVEHGNHAVDDGHDDAAYPVDDGHDGAAYRAEGVLDL